MSSKRIRRFLFVSSVILFLTGVAKIVSATGNAGILKAQDPLFGLTYKCLFYASGFIELCIAVGFYLNVNQSLLAAAVGWYSLCAATYRIAFYFLGPDRWCPCLGNFTDRLHVSPNAANLVLISALCYMLVGSAVVGIRQYHANHTAAGGGMASAPDQD